MCENGVFVVLFGIKFASLFCLNDLFLIRWIQGSFINIHQLWTIDTVFARTNLTL